MNTLITMLKADERISDYKINLRSKESYELFFVKGELETLRCTDTCDKEVTVYVDHGDCKGDAQFFVYPSTTDDQLAEKIREVVKGHAGAEKMHAVTELLLMEAARSQHVREFVLPQLEQGVTVICDRFSDSTIAYQGGARGIRRSDIVFLNDFASAGRKPDLTFLLDLTPEAGFLRAGKRVETAGQYDRFEAEDIMFHRSVRNTFLQLAGEEPQRIKVIDADRSVQEVHLDIIRITNEFIQSIQ